MARATSILCTFKAPLVELVGHDLRQRQRTVVVADVSKLGDEAVGDAVERLDEQLGRLRTEHPLAELRPVLIPLLSLPGSTHVTAR